jgi:hypothetical protein
MSAEQECKTPRTDSAYQNQLSQGMGGVVSVDAMRKLEEDFATYREITNARIGIIRDAMERLETAGCTCYSDPEGACEYCGMMQRISDAVQHD